MPASQYISWSYCRLEDAHMTQNVENAFTVSVCMGGKSGVLGIERKYGAEVKDQMSCDLNEWQSSLRSEVPTYAFISSFNAKLSKAF